MSTFLTTPTIIQLLVSRALVNAFLRVPDELTNGGGHVALLCAALALGVCVARHRVRRVATERGRPKGSGTVVFETSKDAAAVISMYHGMDWYGRMLEVREASLAPAVSAAARTAAGCEICAAGTSADTKPPRSRGDAAEREARSAYGWGGGARRGRFGERARGDTKCPYSRRCRGECRERGARRRCAERAGRLRVPVLAAMQRSETRADGEEERGVGGTGSVHGEASCPRTRGDALRDAAEGDRSAARAVRGACGAAMRYSMRQRAIAARCGQCGERAGGVGSVRGGIRTTAARRGRCGERGVGGCGSGRPHRGAGGAGSVRGGIVSPYSRQCGGAARADGEEERGVGGTGSTHGEASCPRTRSDALRDAVEGDRGAARAVRGAWGEALYPRTRGDALLSASAALGGIGTSPPNLFATDLVIQMIVWFIMY
ncbi:hypothetical protein DFH09DRAFT_1090481 [Mycena vulgaris]|nr:hypothetical protein DFH09DRAFT_1090481 [Mycena vulgaris]